MLSLTKVLGIPVFGNKRLQWLKAGLVMDGEWTLLHAGSAHFDSFDGVGVTFPV